MSRRGITLLEVLFAIFVVAVGLLGLASMIPVGKSQITNANNFDAASTIGRSAMSEIETRDLYHFDDWAAVQTNGTCPGVHHVHQFPSGEISDRFLFDPDGSVLYGAPGTVPPGFTALPMTPFVIDPLFIAKNWNTAPLQAKWFADDGGGTVLWPMRIPRLTLRICIDRPSPCPSNRQLHQLPRGKFDEQQALLLCRFAQPADDLVDVHFAPVRTPNIHCPRTVIAAATAGSVDAESFQ